MSRLDRGQEIVKGAVDRGLDLAFAVRAYTEIGLHYGGIFMRLLGGKRQQPTEEVRPMDLGSFRDRRQRGK